MATIIDGRVHVLDNGDFLKVVIMHADSSKDRVLFTTNNRERATAYRLGFTEGRAENALKAEAWTRLMADTCGDDAQALQNAWQWLQDQKVS